MSETDHVLKVYYKPTRSIVLALISFIFVAGSLWMLLGSPSDRPFGGRYAWAYPWILWIGIPFFGLAGFYAVRDIFDRRPQVRIGPGGIWWRRWGEKEIPWVDISEVRVKSYRGNKLIDIELYDPSAHPSKGSLRWTTWANRALGFGDISIPVINLDRSPEDILEAISRFSNARE